MKSGKPKMAPKVAIPSKKKPNVMREYDTTDKGKNAGYSRKRLSK
jgi:hypothetical protein